MQCIKSIPLWVLAQKKIETLARILAHASLYFRLPNKLTYVVKLIHKIWEFKKDSVVVVTMRSSI